MKVTVELPKEAQGLSEEEIEQLLLIGLREMRVEKLFFFSARGMYRSGRRLRGLACH